MKLVLTPLKWIVVILLILFILVMTSLFLLQRYFIFPGTFVLSPDSHAAYYQKLDALKKTFTPEEGITLSGWLLEKPGTPLMVFYGGNAREAATKMDFLSQVYNYSALAVNYRGFGESTGKPTEKNLISDALFVLDQVMKETGRTPKDIIIIGESLGSGVATQVAAARPVAKLILEVPFDSLQAVALEKIPFLPLGLILQDTFRSDIFAPEVKCPVYIFAAEKDEVIPVHHAQKLSTLFPNLAFYKEYANVGHMNISYANGFSDDFWKACYIPGTKPSSPSLKNSRKTSVTKPRARR